jgi:hypothetical protein
MVAKEVEVVVEVVVAVAAIKVEQNAWALAINVASLAKRRGLLGTQNK